MGRVFSRGIQYWILDEWWGSLTPGAMLIGEGGLEGPPLKGGLEKERLLPWDPPEVPDPPFLGPREGIAESLGTWEASVMVVP